MDPTRRSWTIPSKLTDASFAHTTERLLQGEAIIIPPDQASYVGLLSPSDSPLCLIRGYGDYIGMSASEVAENIQLLMDCARLVPTNVPVTRVEQSLYEVLKYVTMGPCSTDINTHALQALTAFKYFVATKFTALQTLAEWPKMLRIVRKAEGLLAADSVESSRIVPSTVQMPSYRSVINAYIQVLKSREVHQATYFLPTYLCEYPGAINAEDCTFPNLFEYKRIVVPIYHRMGSRWMLAVVTNPCHLIEGSIGTCAMFLFDSLFDVKSCLCVINPLTAFFKRNFELHNIVGQFKHQNLKLVPVDTIKQEPACPSYVYILHFLDTFFSAPYELAEEEQPKRVEWRLQFDVTTKRRDIQSSIDCHFMQPLLMERIHTNLEGASTIDESLAQIECDDSFYILPARYTKLLLAFDDDLMHRLVFLFDKKYVLLPLYQSRKWSLVIITNPAQCFHSAPLLCAAFTNHSDLNFASTVVQNLLKFVYLANDERHELINLNKAQTFKLPEVEPTQYDHNSANHVIDLIRLFVSEPFLDLSEAAYQKNMHFWGNPRTAPVNCVALPGKSKKASN
jgi:hypothetical protein